MPPKKINIRALNIHTENKCCNIKPRVEDKITRMIHSIKGFMTIRLKKKIKRKRTQLYLSCFHIHILALKIWIFISFK